VSRIDTVTPCYDRPFAIKVLTTVSLYDIGYVFFTRLHSRKQLARNGVEHARHIILPKSISLREYGAEDQRNHTLSECGEVYVHQMQAGSGMFPHVHDVLQAVAIRDKERLLIARGKNFTDSK
jgi:hypothetical protein